MYSRALSAFPTARCASWQRQKSPVWRGRVHQGVAFGAWELEPLNRCYAGRYKWGVLKQRSAAAAQIMTAKQSQIKSFCLKKWVR